MEVTGLKYLLLAGLICVSVLGCVGAQHEHVCAISSALIGGEEALDTTWRGVGILGTIPSSGQFEAQCTAVLIGPVAVLTAKHCVTPRLGVAGPTHFGMGESSDRLEQLIELVSIDTMPPQSGGYLGLGSDLAVCHLARPIADVEPFRIAPESLNMDDVGEKLTFVGYGSQLLDGTTAMPALRRRGVQTLSALTGNIFDLIYGGYERFVARGSLDEGAPCMAAQMLTKRYSSGRLLKGYEILAGGAVGDPQTCHGDSGGPLLRERGSTFEIVGVASWSWRSENAACDYGTVYATFGSMVRTAIGEALTADSSPVPGS